MNFLFVLDYERPEWSDDCKQWTFQLRHWLHDPVPLDDEWVREVEYLHPVHSWNGHSRNQVVILKNSNYHVNGYSKLIPTC